MATFTDRIAVLITASSGAAVTELNTLQREAKRTDGAFDSLGKKIGVTGQALKSGLVAGAVALVGTNLVQFLNDSVQAYGDSAKAAGELAKATGGSVDEVSRMTAALMDAGVSSEQSAALLTKFTVNISKNAGAMHDLNVELVRGKDGVVDYAATMVAVVDAIGEIGDGAQRAKLLTQFFGKAGASAFRELEASGVSLAAAMAAISKHRVFNAEDVRRAAAYDNAMDSLAASAQSLQFTLGRALIPALSSMAELLAATLEVVNPIIDAFAALPPDIYLAAGAAVFLSRVITYDLVAGAFTRLAAGIVIVGTGMKSLTTIMLAARGAFAAVGATLAAINPVTAALVALTLAYATFSKSSDALAGAAEDALPGLRKLEEQGIKTADAIRMTAEEMDRTASFWEKSGAQLRGLQWSDLWDFRADDVKADEAALRGFEEQLAETLDEMGEFAVQAAVARDAQDSLNKAVAEFVSGNYATTWADVADSARASNEALLDQKQITNVATAAMGEYAVSIQQVIDWQKKLAGQPGSSEEALNRIQSSYMELVDITDSSGKKLGEKWQLIADDIMTAGDETVIAMSDAKVAILDYVDVLAGQGLPTDQIIANLEETKKKFPDLGAAFDDVMAQLRGKPNEVPIKLVPDYEPLTQIAGLGAQLASVLPGGGITVPVNTEQAAREIEAVANAPYTADIKIGTSGYTETKKILDRLSADRDMIVTVRYQTPGGVPISGLTGGGAAPQSYSTTFRFDQVNVEAPDPAGFLTQMETMAARRRMAGAR